MAKVKKHAKHKKLVAPALEPEQPLEIHVGQVAPKSPLANYKILLIALIGIVLIVLGVVLVMSHNSTKPVDPLTKEPDLVDRSTFVSLSPKEAVAKVSSTTGIDMNALKKHQITKASFKSFSQAYIVAQAFAGMKDYDRSMQSFSAAQAMAPTKVSYKFYLDYAAVADYANKPDQVIELMEKAKQAIRNDATLKEYVKTDEIEKIDNKLQLRKMEN